MALRIFEANLEKVQSAFRSEYELQLDGTYKLKLIDLDDFVAGLKSALRRERELNRACKVAGVTPDGCEALKPFAGTAKATTTTRSTADVRAGLLPRGGTPLRGAG